jgi:hypothetical protein
MNNRMKILMKESEQASASLRASIQRSHEYILNLRHETKTSKPAIEFTWGMAITIVSLGFMMGFFTCHKLYSQF